MININNQKVAVIGSGLIGRAWAIVFARAGLQVNIYDQSNEALKNCLQLTRNLLDDADKAGLIAESVNDIISRIHPVSTLEIMSLTDSRGGVRWSYSCSRKYS